MGEWAARGRWGPWVSGPLGVVGGMGESAARGRWGPWVSRPLGVVEDRG